MKLELPSGAATGIGSLPHLDSLAAARFSLEQFPSLPAIPSLPRRSPAEGLVAQAVVGIGGVTVGHYGSLAVDVRRIDPLEPVVTRLDDDAFGAFRAFVELATGTDVRRPVKWQFVGPLTLGLALARAGVPTNIAFDVAVRAVRAHLAALHRYVAEALPASQQVVVIKEPCLPEMMDPSFPVPPDAAIDLLSGALATVERHAVVGVHCSQANVDWVSVIAAGPGLLALRVSPDLRQIAGYLMRFLEGGGWIAWGAVSTDGPLPSTAERPWRELSSLWGDLVGAGCDPLLLRRQALITPSGGLGQHSVPVVARVLRIVRELADRVHGQAAATQLTVGV